MIYQILQKKLAIFDLPPDFDQLTRHQRLVAKINDFEVMFDMLKARNLNWSLLVTEEGNILGQNFFVDLKITDEKLHRAGKQPPPTQIILLPIKGDNYEIDGSYTNLCKYILNNRDEKTGRFSKSVRHSFYEKFVENFDDLLIKERRGRTTQSRHQPGRELAITKDEIYDNLNLIFPGLISKSSVEKDMTDFKQKVEAARSPKNNLTALSGEIHRAIHETKKPANLMSYLQITKEQSHIRKRLEELDNALESMHNQYSLIIKDLEIHWKSLKRIDEVAIREALDFYAKHVVHLYLNEHFETLLQGLLSIFANGNWNKDYPFFADTGRQIVQTLRITVIELGAFALDKAFETGIILSHDTLTKLETCSHEFVQNQEYLISEAGINLHRSVLQHLTLIAEKSNA